MIPRFDATLPEYSAFVGELHTALEVGELSCDDDWSGRCDRFFSDARLAAIDAVIPGWVTMASYGGGVTLRHTTAALVALMDLAEYNTMPSDQRALIEWVVLLHDMGKRPAPSGRDHCHAFRSAALAGSTLPRLGFGVSESWGHRFEGWHNLTDSAFRFDSNLGVAVQDNAQLPSIIGGADRLFERAAALIIQAIALHLSVTVVPEWPVPVPLTEIEEHELISTELLPVLVSMFLADSGGWNLFNPPALADFYEHTRAVAARLTADRPSSTAG